MTQRILNDPETFMEKKFRFLVAVVVIILSLGNFFHFFSFFLPLNCLNGYIVGCYDDDDDDYHYFKMPTLHTDT